MSLMMTKLMVMVMVKMMLAMMIMMMMRQWQVSKQGFHLVALRSDSCQNFVTLPGEPV